MAAYYDRRFNVKLNPETEIISTLGSKEGFANLAQAITAPGDVILVPNPSYPIHAYGFIIAGGVIQHLPALTPEAVSRLTDLVLNPESTGSSDDEKEAVPSLSAEGSSVAYRFTGYHRFFDPDGYPAVAPPWGTLNAIDLNTGDYLWKIPFGEHPELKAQGIENTGSENYGGPVLTESGLLFIGATLFDRKFRAYDAATGELLWEYEMPYAGMATPAVYMVDGRQYIVIATSNSRNDRAKQGSAYIAFALPE